MSSLKKDNLLTKKQKNKKYIVAKINRDKSYKIGVINYLQWLIV